MYSISLARIAHKALALVACTGAILALTAGPVLAAHPFEITSADWQANKNKLTVKGTADPGDVEVVNANDPAQSIGTATIGNSHRYTITANNPNPVPCEVTAKQPAGCTLGACTHEFTLAVSNAPASCAPKPGGGEVKPAAVDDPGNTVVEGGSVVINVAANDTDPQGNETLDLTSVTIVVLPGKGTATPNPDGTVLYQPNPGQTGMDTFEYTIADEDANVSDPAGVVDVDITPVGGGGQETEPKNAFNILMNYELGMHCTGFEFAYCCVLPVYNSILAQVVKTEKTTGQPVLLEGHTRVGVDGLHRPTVVRDSELDSSGNFQMYVLRYWHEAQPRNDGRGAPQDLSGAIPRIISAAEGSSLLAWNTRFDGAVTRDTCAANPATCEGGVLGDKHLASYDCVINDGVCDTDVDGVCDTGGTDTCTAGDPDLFGTACTTNADCNYIGTNTCAAGDPALSGTACTTNAGCNSTGDDYNGSCNVLKGDGVIQIRDGSGDGDYGKDNYANAILNHFYIYSDLEGSGGNPGGNALEANKLRLGIDFLYKANSGAAFQPLGPDGNFSGFGNVLTFSGDTGTVVYTQMKVLEDLPVMLTSPRIWEALGLPLTPFEDTLNFFTDPSLVNEETVRPYAKMLAQLHYYDETKTGPGEFFIGEPVMDEGAPVIGFGTAPIDIPNCERCHAVPAENTNSPNDYPGVEALVNLEIGFWNSILPGPDNSWYARIKGAAISILAVHDAEHGTSFTLGGDGPGGNTDYPACDASGTPCGGDPQNTRLGHESIICQRCHADNVIAVVKSANCGPDQNCDPDSGFYPFDSPLIPPLTEAIHFNHRGSDEMDPDTGEYGTIVFNDDLGRTGGCQGCHPAHRSDGDLSGYPIDLNGNNTLADNRDAAGGCFVGRDVHSNPLRNDDGAETPSHLNPVGEWLVSQVSNDSGSDKGIWCTNCHSQLSQEMWKAENMSDLVHQVGANNVREPGDADGSSSIDYMDVAFKLGITEEQFINWADPRATVANGGSGSNSTVNTSHDTWRNDPGLCNYVFSLAGAQPLSPDHDANVAVVEVVLGGSQALPSPLGSCSNASDPNAFAVPVDCGSGVTFDICGSLDADGDFNVRLVGNTEPDTDPLGGVFCTTSDCVASAQATLPTGCGFPEINGDNCAFPVPFRAATDGGDHWLSPGEPHCADCHAAPYVEQSGNKTFAPPFNYPRKASLNRYTRGHRDITCQGCHESTHGLYPVSPTIDTTSYQQAASLNADDSHGPLKCGACHSANANGVNRVAEGIAYCSNPGDLGKACADDTDCSNVLDACVDIGAMPAEDQLDAAITWAHTFTDNVDVRDYVCVRCHQDNRAAIDPSNKKWTEHAKLGRVTRHTMDSAEIATTAETAPDGVGHVFGDEDFVPVAESLTTLCTSCHGDRTRTLERKGCTTRWRKHLAEGRASEKAWEDISVSVIGGAADPGNGSICGW